MEVRNQLGYIDQTELGVKLRMCAHFDVRPMFVVRMMPKSYIDAVVRARGFVLVLANQHYPLMSEGLARRVRDRLRLPVLCITELPNTTLSGELMTRGRSEGRRGGVQVAFTAKANPNFSLGEGITA